MFAVVCSLGVAPATARATTLERIEQALNSYDQADVVGSWDDDHVRIVQTVTWNTVESRLEDAPHVCADTGRVIASWVRLDNRAALLEELGVSPDRHAVTTDPMLVLASYDRWSEQCVDHLLGDFSFVIYDPANRSVFAARDPLGVRPLYYHAADDVVIFATTAAVFHVIEDLVLTPSEEWLALYALGVSKSHTGTAWPQVHKLAGGHHIAFHASDHDDVAAGGTPHRYHTFRDDSPDAVHRDDVWVQRYRAVLVDAVCCRVRSSYPLGAETSGGVDSSTCVGFAATCWDGSVDDIHTFGYMHSELEPEYIYETSAMHGLENNHITQARRDPDIEALRARTLTVLGYPAEHGNGPSHDHIYAKCEKLGVRTLLSGFGGDEVVSAQAQLLARELIDTRRFVALYRDVHGHRLLRPLRFARAIQRHRRGSKMESRLMASAHAGLRSIALRDEVMAKYDLSERYRSGYRFDEGFRTINSFALHRLRADFVPTRLENCTLMAQSRRVDYRWPLLDVRLVQQYLSTPSIEKRCQEFGRYLHRRAVEGAMPHKVQWKVSKNMGPPVESAQADRPGDDVAEVLADLHPRLDAIVDRTALAGLVTGELNPRTRRHVASLKALNDWLHRFHP